MRWACGIAMVLLFGCVSRPTGTVLGSDVPRIPGMTERIKRVTMLGGTMQSGTIMFKGPCIDAMAMMEAIGPLFIERGWQAGTMSGTTKTAIQVFSKANRLASVHIRHNEALIVVE
ncbi:MAG: hypothetical protein QGG74_03215 [Phycisphaerales bacterium]|nr:hypothetical protein [Phycisphaerales bacterium]